MKDKIVEMLNNRESFKDIFRILGCTDEEFLAAITEQQDTTFTTVIHDDPNYGGETVAF